MMRMALMGKVFLVTSRVSAAHRVDAPGAVDFGE